MSSDVLKDRLASLGIKYHHASALAPSAELKEIRFPEDTTFPGKNADTSVKLTPRFSERYRQDHLDNFDMRSFLAGFPDGSKVVLYGAQRYPQACHCSIVALALKNKLGIDNIPDITPSVS